MRSPRLPLTLNRFFGREDEIADLADRLVTSGARLVTLTGPGGSGKTRLAIETARRVAGDFPGGVLFVPLTDVRDAPRFPEAIVETLALRRAPDKSALEQIIEALAPSPLPQLLVLDNFEQIAESAALIVPQLLLAIPTLSCLVTSRQRLHVEGEQEFPLAPLPTPQHPGSPERLLEFASIQLFVARAQAARPDFQLTARNAASVAQLCQRLEGIPLALELAAAWSQTLTPAQMLERLDQRFELLVSRRRDAPDRHATLRATIEWSYQRLRSDLQHLFRQLSVFRGGWTLEEAEAVTGEPQIVLGLTELRERSLILAEETAEDAQDGTGDQMRFRMLETLREFGAEQVPAAERSVLAEKHRRCFLRLAEEAEPELRGARQVVWLRRLEAEHDNLRAALAGCRDAAPDEAEHAAEAGLRLAGALAWFWLVRGHWREGREWLAGALDHAGANAHRRDAYARALRGLGRLAWRMQDHAAAIAAGEAGLAGSRARGDAWGSAFSLATLGRATHQRGEHARGRALLDESVALARSMGDRWLLGHCLYSLGHVLFSQGEGDRGQEVMEEGLAALRETGDTYGIAQTLRALGLLLRAQNRPDAAAACIRESIARYGELGDTATMSLATLVLGFIAHDAGRDQEAITHFDVVLRTCRELGDRYGMAHALHNRAQSHRVLRAMEEARADYGESLRLFVSLGYKGDIALSLEGHAELDLAEGKTERFARLCAASRVLREAAAAPPADVDRAERDEHLARARGMLGEERFTAACAEGQSLTTEQAVAFALEDLEETPSSRV